MLTTQTPSTHRNFPQGLKLQNAPQAHRPDDCPHRALSSLAPSGTQVKLAAGETLHLENDPATWCYEVLSGMIKESNTLLDGRCHVAGFVPPGLLLGLSHNGIHQHTAEAVGETRLLRYARKSFDNAIAENPAWAHYFVQQTLQRLNRSEGRVLALTRLTAVERVAQFLLEFAETAKVGTNPIRITISRRDIADYLGLTPETVCRNLATLKKHGFIRMHSPHVVAIPDPERLQALIGDEEEADLAA